MAATGLANLADGEFWAHFPGEADPVGPGRPQGMKRSAMTDGPGTRWIVIDAFCYLADAIITVRSLIHLVWIT